MKIDYVKAYPKYKQEAFNKISEVILKLLNEVDFFKTYYFLANEPRIFLTYNEPDFKREVEEACGGMVKGFHVFVGSMYLFTLRGKEVQTAGNFHKQLTDKEYSTIYNNLEILHQFAEERGTMLESKLCRIVKYNISSKGSEFVGQFGDSYRERKDLAR